jgi:hypothetical protein
MCRALFEAKGKGVVMKQLSKVLLGAIIVLSNSMSYAVDIQGKSFFSQRSQGVNWARWMAGQAHHLYLPDTECINGTLTIIPEYTQTFRSKKIAEYLFFNGTDTMTFGPAKTLADGTPNPDPNAAKTDIFARNFFLNDDFQGTVVARPKVENFILDLNFYLGLDEWVQGLYLRVDVPINWTRWDLRLNETITTTGTTIAAGILGNGAAAPSPLKSIIEAWKGETVGGITFPALKDPMKFARVNGRHSKTSVADITFILGYNFWLTECSHFGLNFVVVAPTGTRPKGEFFFEPVVGNGKHVAVGGGVSGHYEFWNNGCEQTFGVYLEGSVYHLFRAKQHRTFDLTKNGIGSRYLLFKKFSGVTPLVSLNEVVFGPNVTTVECKVKNDVQGDAALMFDYQNCGFTFDIGYNIWGRTKDKITITGEIPVNTFGVQGQTPSASTATQSLTTINGTFAPAFPPGDSVTVTTDDLNPESAEHPGAVSHKIFAHFGYTWETCEYLPFLGIGGEVEFDGKDGRALNQWGIWIVGGFTFA